MLLSYIIMHLLQNHLGIHQNLFASLSLLIHRMFSVDNLSCDTATFNSFLILFNLEKDLSAEQLVTIKLRNRGLQGWKK